MLRRARIRLGNQLTIRLTRQGHAPMRFRILALIILSAATILFIQAIA